MLFDDSDIKIFSDSDTPAEVSNEVAVIAEMTKHRSNGNILKAKQLGKHLAEIFVDEPSLLSQLEAEVGEIKRDEDDMYHIKVLLVFTAEYCINRFLPATLLSNTAVNALYDTVIKKAAEFYDRLDDAAEYSFYYLAVRKAVEISKNIGVSFAMLCGEGKNEYYTNLGKRLFEVAEHEIEKIINSYNFEK
ncbi:MAG: hypothetical protein IKV25_02120 [Clostridia bacterium]|nr:hypothetical protein [Clostridia bacterium]